MLRRKRVKATFHISTEVIPQHKEIIAKILSDGHVLGLRYDPSVLDMRVLSLPQITIKLNVARTILEKWFGYKVKFLRLPYLGYSEAILKHVKNLGFIVTEHSLDSYDYRFTTQVEILSHYASQIQKKCSRFGGCRVNEAFGPSGFISLHRDSSLLTVNWLFAIVNLIYDCRLELVTLEKCLNV